MTVSLNTIGSGTAYQPSTSTASIAFPAAGGALPSTAARLSAESAVVATLSGSTSGAGIYTPSGLLDALKQAGTVTEAVSVPADGSDVDTAGTAQQALDQGIVATLSSTPSASGVYTGTGAVTGGLSEQASANWADLLKTHPNLASTVIGDSANAALVSSLQVIA